LSGADIKAISMEAGMFALRNRETRVAMEYFEKAYEKLIESEAEEQHRMFV